MKSILTSILFTLLYISFAYGQELRLGAGYEYLFSPQLDLIIKTYNFNRPFLENKQPFLKHGATLQLSYLAHSNKNLQSGVIASYGNIQSYVMNPGTEVRLFFNTFTVGHLLHYENEEVLKGFYIENGISGLLSLLYKRVNRMPHIVSETKQFAIQVGAFFNVNIGYRFKLSEKFKISPFAGVGYGGYISTNGPERIINSTNDLIKKSSSLFNSRVGIQIHWQVKEAK